MNPHVSTYPTPGVGIFDIRFFPLYHVAMNTTTITIKTESKLKEQAQQLAAQMGVSLSAKINEFLKRFVKTKSVGRQPDGIPTQYLIDMIAESERDYKEGRYESFDSMSDFIAYLDKEIADEKRKQR